MRLNQFFRGFVYAAEGIVTLFKTQRNARIHLFAALVVIAAGFYFELSSIEWCLIVLTIVLVIALEGVNTAIEFLTDLASPDIHPLAKATKDVAAGAVLIAAIGAAVIGCIIFLPNILALLNGLS